MPAQKLQPEGSIQEQNDDDGSSNSSNIGAKEAKQGNDLLPGEYHMEDHWKVQALENRVSASSTDTSFGTLRKGSMLLIDRQQIQSVAPNDQALELRGLGVDVYDQDVLEHGVLQQIDKAINEAAKVDRIDDAETEQQPKSEDVGTCTSSLKPYATVLEQFTPQTNKDMSRKLDSGNEQNYNKEFKKMKTKQKHLQRIGEENPDEGTVGAAVEEYEAKKSNDEFGDHFDPGPSSLGSMLMSAQGETEWEKLIRTGQMTPFGTKILQKQERKPRRIMLNETSGFEKHLADQEKLLFERKKASFHKGGKHKLPSESNQTKSLVCFIKGKGNKNKGPSKDDSHLQKHALCVQAKARFHKAKELEEREQQEDWEDSGCMSYEDLNISDEEEQFFQEDDNEKPMSWEKEYLLKQECHEDDMDHDFFPSSSEEDDDIIRKRRIKRYKDDGNEDYYKQRLRKWHRQQLKDQKGRQRAGEESDESDVEFLEGFKVPGNLFKKLYKYQQTGVRWLWELHCQQVGGILGDEMGLGKTIQIIVFLASLSYSKIRTRGTNYRCHVPMRTHKGNGTKRGFCRKMDKRSRIMSKC